MGSGLAFCFYLYICNIYFYNVIASPERAWQSHGKKGRDCFVTSFLAMTVYFMRSPRRFAPRDDTGIIAFVLMP